MVGEIPLLNLPDWAQIVIVAVAFIGIMSTVSLYYSQKRHPLCGPILEAERTHRRLALTHFPSGQVEFSVPQPEPEGGNISPVWRVGGTARFKDITGEKWESAGNLKILHYTARNPVPISTNQAKSLDQLNDYLADHGFSTLGIKKEVFYMITEAAKGPRAEAEAWKRLGVQNRQTIRQIKGVLDFIKQNPEVRYQMFKEGAFVYQTAVSVVDQITSDTIVETSSLISFVEDRMRRKLADRMGDILKWVVILLPIMVVAAIACVIVLVGTGAVKLGG